MELPFPQKRTLGVVLRTAERIHSSLRLVPLSHPDGYRIEFSSPIDAPEESELEE